MKDLFVYPAIFTQDDNDLVITFPDFPDSEITVESPFKLAELELGQEIFLREYDGLKIPKPTPVEKISYDKSTQFVSMIEVDMTDIRGRTKVKQLF